MSRLVHAFSFSGGLAVIIGALYYGIIVLNNVNPIANFLHYPSVLVVVGGLVGVSLCSNHLVDLWNIIRILITRSGATERSDTNNRLKALEDITQVYYKDGASSFVNEIENNRVFDKVWRDVAQQLEAKIPIADIYSMVMVQSTRTSEKLVRYTSILKKMGAAAPSFGMFGTILGLVRLLANLEDFSSIGPNMSLALLTTLYGIFFSSVVVGPLAARMENYKGEKAKAFKMLFLWLDFIKEKKPTFYLNESNLKEKS